MSMTFSTDCTLESEFLKNMIEILEVLEYSDFENLKCIKNLSELMKSTREDIVEFLSCETKICKLIDRRSAISVAGDAKIDSKMKVKNSLLSGNLPTNREMNILQNNINAMAKEYELRHKMMIQRFEVTMDCFGWTDNELKKSRYSQISNEFYNSHPQISKLSLKDILAAREDLLIISYWNKTPKCVSKIKSMGIVPDRGGRVMETRSSVTLHNPPLSKFEKLSGRGRYNPRRGGYQGYRQNEYRK